jgi:hypothetical protein
MTTIQDPEIQEQASQLEGGPALFVVTVKLPRDPSRPHPLGCRHKRHNDAIQWHGHCGWIECDNYIQKCPEHSMAGSEGARCNRFKEAAECPVPLNEQCTDATGEHHSVIVQAGSAEQAEQAIRERGYNHITRIERGWYLRVG